MPNSVHCGGEQDSQPAHLLYELNKLSSHNCMAVDEMGVLDPHIQPIHNGKGGKGNGEDQCQIKGPDLPLLFG